MPEAVQVRQGRKNRLRRVVPHQKRDPHPPPPGLGGDETAMRPGGGGTGEGIPPQSPPPLRHGLLPTLQGPGPAGGRAGARQRGHHAGVSPHHRRRAPAGVGAAGAGHIGKQKQYFVCATLEKAGPNAILQGNYTTLFLKKQAEFLYFCTID